MTTVPPAPAPQPGAPAAPSIPGAAVETLSTGTVPATGPGPTSLTAAAFERNAMLAAVLQGVVTSSLSAPGVNSVFAQLVGALVGSEMPAPEAVASSMRAFVRALTTGLDGSADGTKTRDSGQETTATDAVRAAVNALRERARSHAGEPSHDAAAALAEEGIRSLAAQVAREFGAEQQRVAAHWLAEGRAELSIPVDIPGGTGWVRLRVRRRATPTAGPVPRGEAAVALLVELPSLGLVHVAAQLNAGRLLAGIHTSSEPSAAWLCERRPYLEAALGASGLRGWSVDIRADPALVAREWAPWPLPTLEEGSLVDARA